MIEVINQEPVVSTIEIINESVELIVVGGIAVLAVLGIASAIQSFTERSKVDVE